MFFRTTMAMLYVLCLGSCVGQTGPGDCSAISSMPVEQKIQLLQQSQLNRFSVSSDSGWLYGISQDNEKNQLCLQAHLDELKYKLGDLVGEYADPCQACQSIASALAQVETCETLANNLGSTLCDAFLAEQAKESWPSSLLNYGCKGASWLASWTSLYKDAQQNATSICSNAQTAKEFLAQYKIESDCMCVQFIRDSRCQTKPSAQCQQIWKDTTGGN